VADTVRVIACFADIIAMRHFKEGAPLVASHHLLHGAHFDGRHAVFVAHLVPDVVGQAQLFGRDQDQTGHSLHDPRAEGAFSGRGGVRAGKGQFRADARDV